MTRQRGFSLVELLLTVAVLSVLAGLAAPSFARLANTTRAGNATSELTQALAIARIEAIRRGRPVTACPTADGRTCRVDAVWDAGWLVFDDAERTGQPAGMERLIQTFDARSSALAVHASQGRAYVRFQPSGWSSGTNVSIRVCERSARRLIASVILNNAGRARVERPTSPTPCPFDG